MENRCAIVTGGSGAIGSAIVRRLAHSGVNVAVMYGSNRDAAETTAEAAREFGVFSSAYQCDLTSAENVKKTVSLAVKEMGGLDILVNNAGICLDNSVFTMTEDEFDRVLDIDLKGTFLMIKYCYPKFLKKRYGRIVNISSVSGLSGNIGQANYSAAKAGLIGLTKSVAREFASANITCNAVAPGMIETKMIETIPQSSMDEIISRIPLKRIGLPDEVASLVTFLSGEDAGYITGEVIRIDGGMTM